MIFYGDSKHRYIQNHHFHDDVFTRWYNNLERKVFSDAVSVAFFRLVPRFAFFENGQIGRVASGYNDDDCRRQVYRYNSRKRVREQNLRVTRLVNTIK